MEFQAERVRVFSYKFWPKMQYCCKFLFVGEKQTSRPTNWKNDIWLTLENRLRIQNFPREISEIYVFYGVRNRGNMPETGKSVCISFFFQTKHPTTIERFVSWTVGKKV